MFLAGGFMIKKDNPYRKTVTACYISSVLMAAVINITPIIFIQLKNEFNLTYSQFGFLVLVNFITQVCSDIFASKFVDKYGFKPFILGAHVLCFIGFLMFMLSPFLLGKNVYIGFVISTIIFAGSSGLFELLLNPIVGNIPNIENDKAMGVLHSFFSWGQVFVIVSTTFLIFLKVYWAFIILLWCIAPVINFFIFLNAKYPELHIDSQTLTIRQLLKDSFFVVALIAIFAGGATEQIMAQWTSVFMEVGLNIPKIYGDVFGLCGFAVLMGVGRSLYVMKADKFNLHKILTAGSFLCIICYFVVVFSPFPILSVIACTLSGFFLSLLWPGTIIICAKRLPLAGASMYALLATAGDLGASVAPWLTGFIADFSIANFNPMFGLSKEQFALRLAILIATIFPIISVIYQKKLKKKASI